MPLASVLGQCFDALVGHADDRRERSCGRGPPGWRESSRSDQPLPSVLCDPADPIKGGLINGYALESAGSGL